MSRNLYTLNDDNKPIPAPTLCKVDGVTYAMPTQATLRRAHIYAYPLVSMSDELRPPEVEGKVIVFDGYEIRDGAIHPKFRYDDAPPPPPRTFSKLRIVDALTKAGVWPQVKQYIIDNDLYDLYLAAQDFSEDNEDFARGLAALQAALGWTDKKVADTLKQAEM